MLRRQGRTRVPKESPKVSIPVQQDQDRQDGRADVIIEHTAASQPEDLHAKTTFCQDKMYYLYPFKLATVGSLPAFVLEEEDRDHYKYRLATTKREAQSADRNLSTHSLTRANPARWFLPCTS